MAQQHAPEAEETGIDLAPMLDFVMNLLIFFIITTSFVKEAGIQVDKGLAVTAVHKDSGNILIAIRQNGEIWMDRKQVDMREVRPIIERFHIERQLAAVSGEQRRPFDLRDHLVRRGEGRADGELQRFRDVRLPVRGLNAIDGREQLLA